MAINHNGGFLCICPEKALVFEDDGSVHHARCDVEARLSTLPFKARVFKAGDGVLAASDKATSVYNANGVLVAFCGSLSSGVGFATIRRGCTSPAEFVHRLFARYEADFLSRLTDNGSFSFVCFDSNRSRVLAVTDGKASPVYIARDDAHTLFVSTFKPMGLESTRLAANTFSYGTRSPIRSYKAFLPEDSLARAKEAARIALAGLPAGGSHVMQPAAAPLDPAARVFVPSAVKRASAAVAISASATKAKSPACSPLKTHTTPSCATHAADKAVSWRKPAAVEEKPAAKPFRSLAIEAVSSLHRIASSEKIQALLSEGGAPSPRPLVRNCSSNLLESLAGNGGLHRVGSLSNLGPAH